jgi:large subunit ribosomal protein L1
MSKPGKRYRAASQKVDANKAYSIDEGVALVAETKSAKFDETVDVSLRLGIDPKQSGEQVRGSVLLPNGLGKTIRVLVFAQGEKEKDAKEAGADYVGGKDLAEKIEGGWLDFDQVIATPDMMGVVGKLGKVLGPRGLMPNPKTGTVAMDVKRAVLESKSGKAEFKNDKAGNIHAPIGKASFGAQKIKENLVALLDAVVRLKPAASKGAYIRTLTLANTMGPGIRLDVGEVNR